MKKILCLVILIILLTGCSIEKLEYTSHEDTIYKVFSYNTKLQNVSLEGYHYYLPKGCTIMEKSDTNSVIKYNDIKLFLYVDVVSYYHKTKEEYVVNNEVYYSKGLKYNDNFGYLEITKLDDIYFVEFMYNYAKIEVFVEENNLNDVIYQSALILSSVNYHDKVIESLIGNNVLQYKEESFNILKPKKDKEDTNYLDFDYNQVYEDYQGEIKDEDSIEIIEDEER